MFKKGDYVVYGIAGPCLIADVTKMALPGKEEKREYYVLRPTNSDRSTIYSPIDNEKVSIRPVLSKKEAEALLREASKIRPVRIANEKLREEQYKEIMKNGDLRTGVGLLKTLSKKRQSRLDEGRKFTAVDEKYLRETEEMLCSELSIALGEDLEKTTEKLRKRLEKKKK